MSNEPTTVKGAKLMLGGEYGKPAVEPPEDDFTLEATLDLTDVERDNLDRFMRRQLSRRRRALLASSVSRDVLIHDRNLQLEMYRRAAL